VFYKLSLVLSFVIMLVSFSLRNQFPESIQAVLEVEQPPLQSEAVQEMFWLDVDEQRYYVKPLYHYELNGVVVSFNHHDKNMGMHKRNKDFINVADICVVWGANARDLDLNAFEFRSGEWTCYVSTHDAAAWQRFNMDEMSNTHVITEDAYLSRQLAQVKIGDQIQLSGYLAEYGTASRMIRGTSVLRTDTGNGACETLYLTGVEILQPRNSVWWYLLYCSVTSFLLLLVAYIRAPHKV